MTKDELKQLAIRIAKIRQRSFWSPDRQAEKRSITQTLDILSLVESCGYKIINNEPGGE